MDDHSNSGSFSRRSVLGSGMGLAASLLIPASCAHRAPLAGVSERPARIRHYVLATTDMEFVNAQLYEFFGLPPTKKREGPGPTEKYGFYSTMMRIGDTMLEVVEPIADDHHLHGWFAQHGGDGGYMVVMQTFSADGLRRRAAAEGLELTRDMTFQGQQMIQFNFRHFGTHFELYEYTPEDGWWGDPSSDRYSDARVVSGVTGCDVAVADPDAIAAQAARLFLGRQEGRTVHFEDRYVNFIEPKAGTTGLTAIDMRARESVRVGDWANICGVKIRLVE